jgi:hypothetical protein
MEETTVDEPDECETDAELLRRVWNGEYSTVTADMVTRSDEEIIADLLAYGFTEDELSDPS